MAGDVTPSAPQSPPCDGVPLDQHWWIAFLRRGVLRVVQGATGTEGRARYPTYDVDFLETRVLQTQSATRGRSMELSELVRFRHLVLAVCDITGLVWKVQVSDGSVLQRHAIAGGNGDVSRPGKLEWATRKDGRLVMGSVGNRQMDTRTGAFQDRHSEWVKVLSQGGTIENSDWGPVFAALRTAAGVRGDGYLWHEAIEWDALSRRWIVLPRKRGFVTPFEPTRDESMGTNVLLVADEDFRHINVSSVGPLEPEWGFSSVRRVPGMRDVFAALKCREVDGEMQTVRLLPSACLAVALAWGGGRHAPSHSLACFLNSPMLLPPSSAAAHGVHSGRTFSSQKRALVGPGQRQVRGLGVPWLPSARLAATSEGVTCLFRAMWQIRAQLPGLTAPRQRAAIAAVTRRPQVPRPPRLAERLRGLRGNPNASNCHVVIIHTCNNTLATATSIRTTNVDERHSACGPLRNAMRRWGCGAVYGLCF